MPTSSQRLHFIDAMRTFAILMMLQGHFIYEMLQPEFADSSFALYNIWKYFRGITAPVFFTVSGFIFTYLLIRNDQTGWANPRVKKGIRRAFYLILWGYLLRLNFYYFFSGSFNYSFWLVDVLHCIGLSLLGIIGLYLLASRFRLAAFPYLTLFSGIAIFMLHPLYNKLDWPLLPAFLENYVSQINGSVFTILPWFGYAAIGSSLGVLFYRLKSKERFYNYAIPAFLLGGILLIFKSSPFFWELGGATGISLFRRIVENNFLFIRLGDVFIFFSVFMLLRRWFEWGVVQKLGQKTLTIYITHFILLYGSWLGLGFSKFFKHQLNPYEAIAGALVFIIVNCIFAYYFDKQRFISFLKEKSLLLVPATKWPKSFFRKWITRSVR